MLRSDGAAVLSCRSQENIKCEVRLASLQLALKQSTAVFLLLINAGALFIYGIVIDMIELAEKNFTLEAEKHQLNIQNLQYDNLKKLIDEARYARSVIRKVRGNDGLHDK